MRNFLIDWWRVLSFINSCLFMGLMCHFNDSWGCLITAGLFSITSFIFGMAAVSKK